MQSTFSRTRHSSRIFAPDISLDSGAALARWAELVDMAQTFLTLENLANKAKGHRLGSFTPPMAFRNLISEARQAGPGTATVIIGRSSGMRSIARVVPRPGRAGRVPMVLGSIIGTRLT